MFTNGNIFLQFKSMRFLLYLFLALLLISCKNSKNPSPSQQEPSQSDSTAVDTVDAAVDTPQEESKPKGLPFEVAHTMVNPEQSYDEQEIARIFASVNLPNIHAERYIWDEIYGGDDPAIKYVWGYGVEFKDSELKATSDEYFGALFYFFFDESRKTGSLKSFEIISSDGQWYEKFMSDAKAAGLKFNGDSPTEVYHRKGKSYILKTGEYTMYFLWDLSSNGKFEIWYGYDDGLDV